MGTRIEWVAKAVKRTPNGMVMQDIGVGFAHRDGKGISFKFDMYPPDDEKDIDIVIRRQYTSELGIESILPTDYLDLCMVKEYGSGYNKWIQVGWAQRHKDHDGYTLHFKMYRVPQHKIHEGYNLAIREQRRYDVCGECGHSK